MCEGSGVYITVANTGRGDFDGDVTVSFESPSISGAPLPAAKTLHLQLAQYEHSQPLYFASSETVDCKVRVTAAGDCCPENDGWFNVSFPGPARSCP